MHVSVCVESVCYISSLVIVFSLSDDNASAAVEYFHVVLIQSLMFQWNAARVSAGQGTLSHDLQHLLESCRSSDFYYSH